MKMTSYIPSALCGTKKPKHETDPIFSCPLPHRKQKVSLIPAPRNKYDTMQGAPWLRSARELGKAIPPKPNKNDTEQVKNGGQSGSPTFPPET